MNILTSYCMCGEKNNKDIFQGMFFQEHNITYVSLLTVCESQRCQFQTQSRSDLHFYLQIGGYHLKILGRCKQEGIKGVDSVHTQNQFEIKK